MNILKNETIEARVDKGNSAKTLALVLLAVTQFMIVLDDLIVTVALPSIQHAFNLSPDNLQWVVNAYILVFGSFLLLGGRIADLFGSRRVFIAGLLLFSIASLIGGFAQSALWLIGTRALQGLGGAIVSSTALSLLTTIFAEGPERDRAVGIFGSTAGLGAAFGGLLGGLITQFLGWQWILFINVPIGLLVSLFSLRYLPASKVQSGKGSFDIAGALTITGGLVMLVYALVQTDQNGWISGSTGLLFGSAVSLIGLFVLIELRVEQPLVKFNIFQIHSVRAANIVALFFSCCMNGVFFLLSLDLQEVLHYSPLESGLAFLPLTLVTIVVANFASHFITRFGVRPVLLGGLILLAGGTLWFTQIPSDGNYWLNILPGSLVFAVGLIGASVAITIAAVAGTSPDQTGLAAGLINTTQQIGYALGLAILSTIATARTANFNHSNGLTDSTNPTGLTAGFQMAFWVGFGIAIAALFLTLVLFGRTPLAIPTPAKSPDQVELF